MADFEAVAARGDIPDGEARTYTVNGKPIAVCHVEGEYYAIDDVCTHDGGPLGEGYIEDCQIECPRHGARFDIKTGKALTLPAVTGVATYAVRITGDTIEVQVE